MLLDALKKHELLIMNGRLPLPPPMPAYIYTTNMAGQPSKYVCPPPPDHTPQQTTPYATRNSTIVDYFLLPKSLFPEVVFCHTPQHSHTSIPHTYPCPSPNHRWKFPIRIDHNLIALQLLLPAHPILGSKNTEAPPPPRTTYHTWKLKQPAFKEIYHDELEQGSETLLHTLQQVLDNPQLSPQTTTDQAYRLVQTLIQ